MSTTGDGRFSDIDRPTHCARLLRSVIRLASPLLRVRSVYRWR